MFLKSVKEILEGSRTNLFEGQGCYPNIWCKGKNCGGQTGKQIIYKICQSTQIPMDGIGLLIKAKCAKDSAILKEYIEQDRVYDFLVSLNPEYDQVWIQILGKEKVLGLNEVITIITSGESRRGVMLETPTTQSSIMMTKGWNNPRSSIHIRSTFSELTFRVLLVAT